MERSVLGAALIVAPLLAGCQPGPLDSDAAFAPPDDVPASSAPRAAPTAPRSARDRDAPVLDESATLDDVLRYAALHNAGLEARFQEWQAMLERVPQVRALPDPRFTYGYYIESVETRVGPMEHALSLAQTFPWFGTLGDREDAAARDAQAAFQRLEAARLALYERVEVASNDLYFLSRSIDLTSDMIELLLQFERVARVRYQVAAAGHPDIMRIQVELGTMEDRLRRLRDLRVPYVARLNAALDRRSDAEVSWTASLSEREHDEDPDDLVEALRMRNPELLAIAEEVERERIGSAIAKKQGLPDLTLGLAYTVIGEREGVSIPDNGDDALLATLSVSVPIWRDKYDAGVREAVARRMARASAHLDTTNRLTADLQEALFDHHDARRRIELYRDTLIPKATESLQASLGGFQQGTSDFLDVLDTQRTLLEFQLALERARVDRASSAARIERLVGTPRLDVTETTP